MLYHYTDGLTAADIRRDGVIRAQPITLHRDALAKDAGYVTGPIVWLTTNPILDGTVIAKMMAGGWPKTLLGDLWRFAVRDDYPAVSLGDYVDAHKIDEDWWEWTVRTGAMAGSDYTTWRLAESDVPAAEWGAVEALAGIDATGTIWTIID